MAHLTEGTLRRMVDDPDARTAAEASHIESCAECQARFKAVSDDAGTIAGLLAVPAMRVDVASAFNRVKAAPAATPTFGIRLPIMRPTPRPLILAFATVVAAMALLVTAVGEGNNFFAPTSVTPVPISIADIQSLQQLGDYGTITWTQQPQPQIVANAAEAVTVSGMQPPSVSGGLPAGISTTVTYLAMPKAVAVFTFSKDKAAAKAAGTGRILPALPTGMDGATLTVTAGPAVAAIYGNIKAGSATDLAQADLPQLIIVKSSAPSASSKQVTVKQLEDYLLAQPGISPELAAAVRAVGDPSTTLLVPVPTGYATSNSVQVQGVTGLTLGDNTGLGAAVVWIKGGVVYFVGGTLNQADVLGIANHVA